MFIEATRVHATPALPVRTASAATAQMTVGQLPPVTQAALRRLGDRRHARGVTLMEVMVVIVILGLISAGVGIAVFPKPLGPWMIVMRSCLLRVILWLKTPLLTIEPSPLTAAQSELLIGTEGATIDAIQYLANASLNINQEADLQAGYTIELNGYRQERAVALKAIADDAATQVRANGTEVVLQPMSSAERRQMHTFFDSDPSYSDLSTYSRGQEPDRRLVVKLAQSPAEPELESPG